MRDKDDITLPSMTKQKQEFNLKEYNNGHPYGAGLIVPHCIFDRVYRKTWHGILTRTRYEHKIGYREPNLTPDEIQALLDYVVF